MKTESQLLVDAIRLLKPTSEFVISNDDYSTITWHSIEGTAPTQAEVTAAIAEVTKADAAAQEQQAKAKGDLFTKLGITADEARLLLS